MQKKILAIVVSVFAASLLFLYAAPPDLLRVASNYAAKIVCSNVFIAKRDADFVLKQDVIEALGISIVKLMLIDVDREERLVRAGLLGVFGRGRAIYRPGTGCAVVPDGNVAAASRWSFNAPALSPPSEKEFWPKGSGSQIVDSIQSVIASESLAGIGMRAIVVIHDGKIIAERYGAGFDKATPLLGWSMTKTVNAALVGMVIKDNKLSLGQSEFWPKSVPPDAREKIDLAHLLAMSSGLHFSEEYGGVSDVSRMLFLEADMPAFVRSLSLEHDPGETWSYSSGTSVLLSSIWQKAVGNESLLFPRKHLFEPLGMSSAIIEADARGNFVGSSYMYANAQDWARFGQFILQDGSWNGEHLLPDGFATRMRTASDTSKRYSKAQMWCSGPSGAKSESSFGLPSDTVWMLGHNGQSTAIVPSEKLVVVRLGLTPGGGYQPQGLLAAIIKALK